MRRQPNRSAQRACRSSPDPQKYPTTRVTASQAITRSPDRAKHHSMLLVPRRVWIVPVAIAVANFAVSPVNYNFNVFALRLLGTATSHRRKGMPFNALSFRNNYADRRTRFEQDMRWKNVGAQPVAAFEIVILKYDAFDQRMIGSRWVVTGRDSANWSHLPPGETAGDGTGGFGSEEVMTAIAYVRAVRLADGTVWRANEPELLQKLRQVAPGIKDYGSVRPDAKPATEQK